jgi:hypothetical protein
LVSKVELHVGDCARGTSDAGEDDFTAIVEAVAGCNVLGNAELDVTCLACRLGLMAVLTGTEYEGAIVYGPSFLSTPMIIVKVIGALAGELRDFIDFIFAQWTEQLCDFWVQDDFAGAEVGRLVDPYHDRP